MANFKAVVVAAVVAGLLVTTVAACDSPQAPTSMDRVTVQLKWLHSAQFAGFYVADQKGFYAKENLAVSFIPGGPAVNAAKVVASGAADFGLHDGANVLLARQEGVPVKAIGVMFQIAPGVLMALKESGIERPEDFVGRRVAVGAPNVAYWAMLKKLGIDGSQIEHVPYPKNLEPFFGHQVDVQSVYLTDQVITAREEGYEVNIILPGDYGVRMYGDTLFTSEALIQEKPGLVGRFLRATLRGWRYAIENPEEAAEMTLKYDSTLDRAHEQASLEASIPLVFTGTQEIGWMEREVWEQTRRILAEGGQLGRPLDLDRAFTMVFLHNIYEKGQPGD